MPGLMLTEEERMLQSTVRDFVDREVAPGLKRWTRRRSFPGITGREWPP